MFALECKHVGSAEAALLCRAHPLEAVRNMVICTKNANFLMGAYRCWTGSAGVLHGLKKVLNASWRQWNTLQTSSAERRSQ